jgi:hypothetical protein
MGTVQAAPYSLFLDLYRGVVRGAYAIDDLHAPGLLVWILMGFVPGVGTLAAMRDGYYSLEVREWGALFLNLLGLIPFIKGFANIADLAMLHRLRHTAHLTHQVAHVARHRRALKVAQRGSGSAVQRSATAASGSAHAAGTVVLVMNHDSVPRQNAWAWPAALLALITFAVAPMIVVFALLAVGGQSLFAVSPPLPAVAAAAVTPVVWSLLILLLAVKARRVARRMRGRPFARPGVSALAFWLGLCALILMAFAAGMALLPAVPITYP